MSRVRTWAARLARGHTRLAVRLFLFNALLVFLPVAGLWYLAVVSILTPAQMLLERRFARGILLITR